MTVLMLFTFTKVLMQQMQILPFMKWKETFESKVCLKNVTTHRVLFPSPIQCLKQI